MSGTNALIRETSPYLLQHAHNPVNWYPWGEEALARAREENKLVVVSIGYSSCHWCHVMEQESFEDPEVAALMNQHFISIKVDREERPDIDHIYMTAVQLINMQGGWPLNCVALPDGRPIWGGTYFPKERWMEALTQVFTYYAAHREETLEYASGLEEGIRQTSIYHPVETSSLPGKEEMAGAVDLWSRRFDKEYGGALGSPKFPMPPALDFLLHYGVQYSDRRVLDHLELTLTRMARGGIYDQAGGGFARYSVDNRWKVPHFEKMLYDNGQLIGLYATAFQVFGTAEYEHVVRQSIDFVKRELASRDGAFFCALDADSEGVEGKYYVWSREELRQIIGNEFELFSAYYNITGPEQWESDSFVLFRSEGAEEFADASGLEVARFEKMVQEWHRKLLLHRSQRIPPGLDDKSLTSWSSLMITALVQAYRALDEDEFLEMALDGAALIRDRAWKREGVLYHKIKGGKGTIPGFHIDYALFTGSCLDLYEATMDRAWLDLALELTGCSMEHFPDAGNGMFFYSSDNGEKIIFNQVELQDNVIPSSNSVMAHILFRLGHIMEEKRYLDRGHRMAVQASPLFLEHPQGYANWGRLLLKLINPFYEIAVVGPGATEPMRALSKEYMPHAVLVGCMEEEDLPLFRHRFLNNKTRIFVCRDTICQIPVEKTEDAKRICHINQAT